jgi:hypothetical protein
MKVYIIYLNGEELPRSQWIKAANHNAAEKKARAKHPTVESVIVSETEI